jgi:hypothetical protein
MATTRIPPDVNEFLQLLKAHDVRFLHVGGYAVNAFGRAAEDLAVPTTSPI